MAFQWLTIQDLPAARDVDLARQVAIELAEQLLDQTRLRQPAGQSQLASRLG